MDAKMVYSFLFTNFCDNSEPSFSSQLCSSLLSGVKSMQTNNCISFRYVLYACSSLGAMKLLFGTIYSYLNIFGFEFATGTQAVASK
jgi:hypothetical protein